MVGSSSSSACGLAEQRLRQQHAHLLAALQLAHLALVQRLGNVEAVEQDRGVALGGVAVLFADDAFELAQPHAVFVGHARASRRCASRSSSASHSGMLPMMTVSITR